MSKRTSLLCAGVLMVSLAWVFLARHGQADDSDGPGGPPFPNDTGPDQIDISKYPPDMKENYQVFARRCSQCHGLARPINSQIVQLSAKEEKIARIQEPELFQDKKIWNVGEGLWNDYMTRMYIKPGSSFRIHPTEVDRILEFLIYDAKVRKRGGARDAWRDLRQKLLDDFKKNNPKRYAELFG